MPVRSSLLVTSLALLCALGGGLEGRVSAAPMGESGLGPGQDSAQELERRWRGERDLSPLLEQAGIDAAFRPRFESLALAGSGGARLWLLEVGWPAGQVLDAAALRARLGLYRDLVREQAQEPRLLLPRLPALIAAERHLPDAAMRDLALDLSSRARDPELAAGALLALAQRTAPPNCEDRAIQDQAGALCEGLLQRWPQTLAARGARDLLWRLEHLAVGRVAPAFVTHDARGNELRSEHLRGRVTVVCLWRFTGPAPWRARQAEERRWRERLWDERFTWLGVNLDPDSDAFRRHCEDRDIDWKQHAWEGGRERPLCQAWRVGQEPLLILLDDQGVVRGVDLEPKVLEARAASLLTELRAKIANRETHLEDNAKDGR